MPFHPNRPPISVEGGIEMRRMIVTAAALAALAVPGAAIAAHQGKHQRSHEARHGVHHKRHHRHAHIVRFGAVRSSVPASGTSSPSPAQPSGPTDETAGTVASFTNGTLTITLKDSSTVSGKVTDATEIECRAVMASAASDGHGDQGDDHGDTGQSSSGPGDGQQGEVSGHDDGDADDEAPQQQAGSCTSAALVPGAVVREAELRVSSAGAVWEKVELNQ
jgi:hypothetical protein